MIASSPWLQVMRQVSVVDTCQASSWLRAKAGAVYLLEFTYQDKGVCHLACFEQTVQSSEHLQNRPCPAPSAEEKKIALDE